MTRTRLALAFVASTSLMTGCVGEIVDQEPGISVERHALDQVFEDAGKEFGVPAILLKAIGYVETKWEMVQGHAEFDGIAEARGLMALRGERLTRAADLAGLDVEDVAEDIESNIRAAAALMDALATEHGLADRNDLGAWAPVVAAYSGIEDLQGQRRYVVDEVYATINDGVQIRLEGDVVVGTIPPTDVTPDFDIPEVAAAGGTVDHSGAVWHGSPNYSSRPGGAGDVEMVIIHTCEGGYAGCWGWLVNSSSGVSAHYVVNTTGSEISQLVRESNKAWHIGATYNSSLNNGVLSSKNGTSSNNFTVGIEHAGYASQATWPAGQIEASANLVCGITQRHGIVRDRYHIVGHGKLQPYNRVDPGANWPWTNYINRIKEICGDTGGGGGGSTPPPTGTGFVVDSNNANNDPAKARITVSGNWTASQATGGYYGTGYWFASTQAVSDGAAFEFYLPAAASMTIDAWWTAGTNRSSATPFVAFNAAGTKLGSVTKDQRSNGGQWNTIGTYNFTAGWNKIVVSRWAAEGSVVIADAIRVR